MLTPLDQIASQNLQMAKAAVSFFPRKDQKLLAITLKIMEIQNLLHYFRKEHAALHACNSSQESRSMLDMLTGMRNYCEGGDQEMLDQWIQILSTMELCSMMSSMPDLTEQFETLFRKESSYES